MRPSVPRVGADVTGILDQSELNIEYRKEHGNPKDGSRSRGNCRERRCWVNQKDNPSACVNKARWASPRENENVCLLARRLPAVVIAGEELGERVMASVAPNIRLSEVADYVPVARCSLEAGCGKRVLDPLNSALAEQRINSLRAPFDG